MYRLIIEHIIRHILQEEEFTNLNVKSFVDHESRTDKFVKYLSSGTPITFKGVEPRVVVSVKIQKKGEKKPTEYDPKDQANELKSELPKLEAGDKLYLVDEKGKAHSITTVSKTRELGGKGKGGSLGPERRALASLQSQFEQIQTPITLVIGSEKFERVDGVVNVKENQKADFAFTVNSKPAIFISYKPGSNPRGMISYGGITKEQNIEEVQQFISKVKAETSSMKENRVEYGAPVLDPVVQKKVLYGYQEGEFGINNVQAIVQGDNLELVKTENSYTLNASNVFNAPSIPEGDYAPYYNARYASDRSQYGIQNCRFGVIPVGARKMEILK